MKAVSQLLASAMVLAFASLLSAETDAIPMSPQDGEAVILFLLDNSASLPPLDPNTQRRDAIEKIYSFLRGQPYRLILFGGRSEIHIDAPQHYRNAGQWTDFYFAFDAARKLIAEYPEGTDFKMVLITDGKIDPSPKDWRDQHVAEGIDLRTEVGDRTARMLEEIGLPLYVILIGEEVDYELIQKIVLAANGSFASSDYAQGIADFFDDDGMLLRRFIFRVEKDEGLEVLEPIVRRISTPPAPGIEFGIIGSLMLGVAALIGVGVRSFPGAGDREVLELRTEEPLQVAADRLRRLSSDVPAWSWKGLSLVESSRHAVAMMTAHPDSLGLAPTGYDLGNLGTLDRELIGLSLPELGKRIEQLKQGSKDEQSYAINLDYAAGHFDDSRVERLIAASLAERKELQAIDFLRAKVHLLSNQNLANKLTGPSVSCKIYGVKGTELELRPGSKVRLGRYEFLIDELTKGGRKDFRMGLTYEQVPSPLFLKRIIPVKVQKALRMRRSHERIVK